MIMIVSIIHVLVPPACSRREAGKSVIFSSERKSNYWEQMVHF